MSFRIAIHPVPCISFRSLCNIPLSSSGSSESLGWPGTQSFLSVCQKFLARGWALDSRGMLGWGICAWPFHLCSSAAMAKVSLLKQPCPLSLPAPPHPPVNYQFWVETACLSCCCHDNSWPAPATGWTVSPSEEAMAVAGSTKAREQTNVYLSGDRSSCSYPLRRFPGKLHLNFLLRSTACWHSTKKVKILLIQNAKSLLALSQFHPLTLLSPSQDGREHEPSVSWERRCGAVVESTEC